LFVQKPEKTLKMSLLDAQIALCEAKTEAECTTARLKLRAALQEAARADGENPDGYGEALQANTPRMSLYPDFTADFNRAGELCIDFVWGVAIGTVISAMLLLIKIYWQ
jgi:tetrahydromethanopterin S-methyltransferase subunit B